MGLPAEAVGDVALTQITGNSLFDAALQPKLGMGAQSISVMLPPCLVYGMPPTVF